MGPCDAYNAFNSFQPEEQRAELVDTPNMGRQRNDRHISVLLRHALRYVHALIGHRGRHIPEKADAIPRPDLDSHRIQGLCFAPGDCYKSLFLCLVEDVRAVPTVDRDSP